MAQTKKGIIYPNNYEQIADIPEDLKNLAESVDDAIDNSVSVLEKQIIEEMEKAEEGFNSNAKIKLNEFNNNVETKTTDFNKNAETKTEEFNTNATNKVNEFNNNVDSIENELTELASQMPWNTTEIQDSINVNDSAKYSRNKLGLFGNLVQEKREGYNLIEPKMATVTVKGITCTNNKDGSFTLNGTATSSADFRINQLTRTGTDNLKTYNGAHTLICNELIDGVKVMCMQETTYSTPIIVNSTTKSKSYTFNNMEKIFIVVIVSEGITVNNLVIKPMLIAGTEIKPYEQYGVMPSIEYPSMPITATSMQKIKRIGKNFLNVEKNASSTALGITATTDENGIITINGTTSAGLYLGLVKKLNAIDYSKISQLVNSKLCKGVYKVSFKYISGTVTSEKNNTNMQFRDNLTTANATITKSISNLGNSDKAISITLDKDKECYTYLWADTGTVFTNFKFTIHIEKVESETNLSTEYEPYKEEIFELNLGTIELCKIVNTVGSIMAQDKVVYKDGKWQFAKNVGKLVLDGTQEIVGLSVSDITTRIQYRDVVQASDLNKRNFSNCNMLKYKSIWSLDEEAYYLDNASLGIIIRIRKDIIGTSKTSISEFFANNNLVVYYPLQETTYEDCTQEQSQVLDKLYKLSLQKGTNNIFVESENGVTTELQLTHMQDLMSQINELKQAIINIGGN